MRLANVLVADSRGHYSEPMSTTFLAAVETAGDISQLAVRRG